MSSIGSLSVTQHSFTYKSRTYSKQDIKEIRYYPKGSAKRIWEGLTQLIMFFVIFPIFMSAQNLFSNKVKVRLFMRKLDDNGQAFTKAIWMTVDEATLLKQNY